MPRIEPISDPADPRVDVYRDQTDAWLRAPHNPDAIGAARDDPGADPVTASGDGPGALPGATSGTGYTGGLFMAEGELVLHHLLASRFEPESVLITPTRLDSVGDALDQLAPETPVYVAERAVMGDICGFNIHRGVLAAARRGPAPDPLEIAQQARTLVILEDLTNHDNVGSVFRSAAALVGIERVGVLVSPRCCDPLYRKAIRVSMGLALRVPFATLDPWPGGLDALASLGFETIALATGPGAEDLDAIARARDRSRDCSRSGRVALVIGSEGPGLTGAALDRCARRARIAMAPGVDSLNAGVAAAIALHRLAPVP